MALVRAELTQHLGGKPTAPQRILIDRAAALLSRLHLMDRESARSGEMSERNGRRRSGLEQFADPGAEPDRPGRRASTEGTPRPFWERMNRHQDLVTDEAP